MPKSKIGLIYYQGPFADCCTNQARRMFRRDGCSGRGLELSVGGWEPPTAAPLSTDQLGSTKCDKFQLNKDSDQTRSNILTRLHYWVVFWVVDQPSDSLKEEV